MDLEKWIVDEPTAIDVDGASSPKIRLLGGQVDIVAQTSRACASRCTAGRTSSRGVSRELLGRADVALAEFRADLRTEFRKHLAPRHRPAQLHRPAPHALQPAKRIGM